MSFIKNPESSSLSKILIIVITVVVFIFNLYLARRSEGRLMSIPDVQQYYTYLPAVLIHNDLSLSYRDKNPEKLHKYVWGMPSPSGKALIMTTMGLSILYSPTFFLSHIIANQLNYENDGYSLPYYIGLQFNALIYLFIGLLFLRKVLLKYFNESITSFTILILFFGTNLYYYSIHESPMPHAYEFSLTAIFIYYTIRWHEIPKPKYAILIGLLSGIISLIRPTDIIILLFLILWRVTKMRDLWERAKFFYSKWYHVMIMASFFILVWIPQFLYWRNITGHYLFYSYDSTSHFDFLSPHIIEGLFSYRKGWLVYTPVMTFSLPGIIILYKKHKEWFNPVLFYTILNIYIVLSWFCWWYGGSFGLRAFVDSYSILSIPLAAFIAWAVNKKPIFSYSFIALAFLLIIFNLFQVAQYRNEAIHYTNMTKKAYWETFGKLKPTKNFHKYLEEPPENP